MASSAKRKTTMAKRNREIAVFERRARKQARKAARKQAAADAATSASSDVNPDGGSTESPHVTVGGVDDAHR
jgi:nicotinamide mononucleotide (NMN) deamidase PncC